MSDRRSENDMLRTLGLVVAGVILAFGLQQVSDYLKDRRADREEERHYQRSRSRRRRGDSTRSRHSSRARSVTPSDSGTESSGRTDRRTERRRRSANASFSRAPQDGTYETQSTVSALDRSALDPLADMLARNTQLLELKKSSLRRVAPVRPAPADVIDFLADNMQYSTKEAGDYFCIEREYGDCMFVIAMGAADMIASGRLVKTLSDGDYFGETAAMNGCLRVATIRATRPCHYFTITREILHETIVKWPALKENMDRQILRRTIEREYSVEEQKRPEVQDDITQRVQQELDERRLQRQAADNLQWKLGKQLASGAFGDVFSGMNTVTGEPLAVKVIRMGRMSDVEEGQLRRESEMMTTLQHENVVRGLGLVQDAEAGKIYILMELVPLGSLKKLLRDMGSLPEAVAREYTTQMLNGLAYLHSKRVLHRDIKPANVLIAANGKLKLADFGISRFGLHQETQTITGTPAYLSPDALNGRYSIASDIWALGCTVLELVTGKQPWSHLGLESCAQIVFAIASAPEPHPIPETISPQLRSLLELMMHATPEERPSADQLLRHEWFTVPADELPKGSGVAATSEDIATVLLQQETLMSSASANPSSPSFHGGGVQTM